MRQEEIEQLTEVFEQECNEELQKLKQLKQMWEEKKSHLQQQAYDEGFATRL